MTGFRILRLVFGNCEVLRTANANDIVEINISFPVAQRQRKRIDESVRELRGA